MYPRGFGFAEEGVVFRESGLKVGTLVNWLFALQAETRYRKNQVSIGGCSGRL
jgi:hypothetical protein